MIDKEEYTCDHLSFVWHYFSVQGINDLNHSNIFDPCPNSNSDPNPNPNPCMENSLEQIQLCLLWHTKKKISARVPPLLAQSS